MDNPKSVEMLKEINFGDQHFADALNSLISESELQNTFNDIKDSFYDDTEYLDYLSYFKK